MKLKGDFIEAISRLYIEKHKPELFKKLVDDEQKSQQIFNFSKIALNNRDFYTLIKKPEGFLAL